MNWRAVLATWDIGVGYQGLVKFACVIIILPRMNEEFKIHTRITPTRCKIALSALLKKACSDCSLSQRILWAWRMRNVQYLLQDTESGAQGSTLHLVVSALGCLRALEKFRMVSASWEGEGKELMNFISSGNNISINVRQIFLVLLVLWILQVCF